MKRGIEGDFLARFPYYRPEETILWPGRIAFGRPVIARRGISTTAIRDRVNAGESEEEIAQDYGLDHTEVEEAIVYEQAA